MEDRWGDYMYYRMNRIVDVYFAQGFGTLNWIKLEDYCSTSPDAIVTRKPVTAPSRRSPSLMRASLALPTT